MVIRGKLHHAVLLRLVVMVYIQLRSTCMVMLQIMNMSAQSAVVLLAVV